MTLLLLLLLVVFLFAILGGARGPIWTNRSTVIRRRSAPRVIEEVYEDDRPAVVEDRVVERPVRRVERVVERDDPLDDSVLPPPRRRIVER